MKRKINLILSLIALLFLFGNHGIAQDNIPFGKITETEKIISRGDETILYRSIDSADMHMHLESSQPDISPSPELRIIIELEGIPLAKVYRPEIPAEKRKAMLTAKQIENKSLLDRLGKDIKSIYRSKHSSYSVKPEFGPEYTRLILGQQLIIDRNMIESVRQLPYVKRVHIDRTFQANLDESVPQIHADSVWHMFENEGDSIRVGIIDTGIDYMHPDLGGGYGPGYKVVGGYDFVNQDEDPMDDNYHGTHVAGIVAADGTLKGVAPKALLFALKVLDGAGMGYLSDIVSAVEWAVDPNGDLDFSDRLDIVNLSLGSEPTADDPVVDAIEAASKLGVVFCVSAGNRGFLGEFSIGSPGVSPSAITTGMVDKENSIHELSSMGPARISLGLKPEIVAPGVFIHSTFPGEAYEILSGTSMGSPHIAGVCALLKRKYPDWGPAELKSAIMLTAKDLGEKKTKQGAGLVNAYDAVMVNTRVEKPSLNFGLDTIPEGNIWTSNDTLNIKNISEGSLNYSLEASGQESGIAVAFSDTVFTLEPDADTTVVVSLMVDNTIFDQQDSMNTTVFTGDISLNADTNSYTIPYLFLRAIELKLSDTTNLRVLALVNNTDVYFIQEEQFGEIQSALFPPAEYYLFAGFHSEDDAFFIRKTLINKIALFTSQTIETDSKVFRNEIIFNTTDELGRTHSDKLQKFRNVAVELEDSIVYTLQERSKKVAPDDWVHKVIWISYNRGPIKHFNNEYQYESIEDAPCLKLDTLYFSDLPEGSRVILAESGIHRDDGVNVYFNEKGPLDGITEETILSTSPSGYRSLVVQQADSMNNFKWYPKFYYKSRRFNDFHFASNNHDDTEVPGYTIHLSPTPDIDENFNYYLTSQKFIDYYTSPLRLIDDTFYYGEGKVPGALPIPVGDTIAEGEGPWYSVLSHWYDPYWPIKAIHAFYRGSLNEESINPGSSSCELFNEEGVKVDSLQPVVYMYQDPGRYQARIRHTIPETFFGMPVVNFLDTWFNISSGDETPPVLTSFYFKDFQNRKTASVQKNDSLIFVFGLGDGEYFTDDDTYYDPVLTDSTSVYAKYHYSDSWNPIAIDSLGYDPKTGIIFSGEFRDTDYDTAHIDIKIRTVEPTGNSTETIISPALYVKDFQPPIAVDDFYELSGGWTFISTGSILDNDTNPLGRTEDLGFHLVSDVMHGELRFQDDDGSFAYYPGSGFEDIDSFSYRVWNEKYFSNVGWVTLRVLPEELELPGASSGLINVFPNPASDHFTILFSLDHAEDLNIDLYELTGQKCASICNGSLTSGNHEILWEAAASEASLRPGVYIISVRGNKINEQLKIVLQ